MTKTKTTQVLVTKQTISILRNFAGINANIQIPATNKGDTTVCTISSAKNLYASASISEQFPIAIGIWDLPKFLSTLSMFQSPLIEIEDGITSHISIVEGNSATPKNRKRKIVYFLSDAQLLTIPSKKINMPEHIVEFDLDETTIAELTKAASVLSVSDICIQTSDDGLNLTICDKNNSTSDSYTVELDSKDVKFANKTPFKLYMKVENLKFLPASYRVRMAAKISEWHSPAATYIVALDQSSGNPTTE